MAHCSKYVHAPPFSLAHTPPRLTPPVQFPAHIKPLSEVIPVRAPGVIPAAVLEPVDAAPRPRSKSPRPSRRRGGRSRPRAAAGGDGTATADDGRTAGNGRLVGRAAMEAAKRQRRSGTASGGSSGNGDPLSQTMASFRKREAEERAAARAAAQRRMSLRWRESCFKAWRGEVRERLQRRRRAEVRPAVRELRPATCDLHCAGCLTNYALWVVGVV